MIIAGRTVKWSKGHKKLREENNEGGKNGGVGMEKPLGGKKVYLTGYWCKQEQRGD